MIQTYRGHVTISPIPTLHDYEMLITDVEPLDGLRAMRHTYNLTVQRISHVRSLFGIEREFERYFLRLRSKIGYKKRHDRTLLKYHLEQNMNQKEKGKFQEKDGKGLNFCQISEANNSLVSKLSQTSCEHEQEAQKITI